MIGKKIENPKKSANKSVRITRLTHYIEVPETSAHGEKCVYSGARGFLTTRQSGRIAEMIALAEGAPRSRDPVVHYVLSWREGEHPQPVHIEGIIDCLIEQFGLQNHQMIYGLHCDTENTHLHVEINRVHPDTLKCIEINGGFDLEALHMAVARIEALQGWSREPKGRYRVAENGNLVKADRKEDDQICKPRQSRCDVEHRKGETSAERRAIQVAGPILQAARSWQELHENLQNKNCFYEKVGSGAVIFVGDIAVKASRVNRNASLGKLEKKLGPYEGRDTPKPDVAKEKDSEENRVSEWDIFQQDRSTYNVRKADEKRELDVQYEGAQKALSEQQKAQRDALSQRCWKRRGKILNALRHVMAREHLAEREALKVRYQREKEAWRGRYQSFPTFREWLTQRENFRVENHGDVFSFSGSTGAEKKENSTTKTIKGFVAKIIGAEVVYRREGGDGRIAFVDKGQRIDIYEWRDTGALLAGLQLAADKWGALTVTGSQEFKERCVMLAVQYDLTLCNPELQSLLAQRRRAFTSADSVPAGNGVKDRQHSSSPSRKGNLSSRTSRSTRLRQQDFSL